jgi:hypothetical protein
MNTTKYALYSPSLGFLLGDKWAFENYMPFGDDAALFKNERAAKFRQCKLTENTIILPVTISYTFEVPSSTNSTT